MNLALIDIGSNTMKVAVYRVFEDLSFEQLLYRDEYVGLFAHIQDGVLDDTGFSLLCSTLSSFAEFSRLHQAEQILAFATAALRKLKDPQTLISRIREQTGLTVCIISGEEESLFDFLALKEDAPEDSVMLDLGGGSGQVILCKNGERCGSVSLPIGSLKLYEEFVQGRLPTPSEAEALQSYVTSLLKEHFPSPMQTDTLYVMSGTARALPKLCLAFGRTETSLLELCAAQALYDEVLSSPSESFSLLSRVAGQRAKTLFPGLFAIMAVCKYFGAQRFLISPMTVKEGYLRHYLSSLKA